ncbi:MAG: zinc ribbon domain-containing protein [Ruminococcaceae bacterium]|nr:zinc ribbon domain-containing protein [Oscillospiraceae bacterium]
MYCSECGTKLEDNAISCPNCKKNINNTHSETKDIIIENYEPVSPSPQKNPEDKVPLGLWIALGTVSFLLIVFIIVVLCVNIAGNADHGFAFTCEETPAQTNQESIVLKGTIKSSDADATLTLNGQIIETLISGEKEKVWSEPVSLNDGENFILLTFASADGHSETRVLHIDKQSSLLYDKGTVLNLNTTNVYIRPTPSKSDKYVVLLYYSATDLVCLGEEEYDSEGYLWIKVNTPANGPGWVRSDLVKLK